MQQFTTMWGRPLHMLRVLRLRQQWRAARAALATDPC